jgi:hypothetical protein
VVGVSDGLEIFHDMCELLDLIVYTRFVMYLYGIQLERAVSDLQICTLDTTPLCNRILLRDLTTHQLLIKLIRRNLPHTPS